MEKKRFAFRVLVLSLLLSAMLASCDDGTDRIIYIVYDSDESTDITTETTPPAALDVIGISYDDESVTFEWVEPTESDFSYAQVSYSEGISTTTTSTAGIAGLNSSTEYTFILTSVDIAGNESDEVSFTFLTAEDDSEEISFTLIETASELAGISNELDGSYILMEDIDLSDYNSGVWTPIGIEAVPFTGNLYGNNHIVSNLYVNNNDNNQGLFGYIYGATIRDLGLENLEVIGSDYTGGLVGYTIVSTITACYTMGTVTGDSYTGGLVGEDWYGIITACSAAGAVTGDYRTGGLVGRSLGGTITACSATGVVTGKYDYTGGLVGRFSHEGTITVSSATGTVTGDDSTGGLVGYNNSGTITACFATGAVTGIGNYFDYDDTGDNNGGLVGYHSYGT